MKRHTFLAACAVIGTVLTVSGCKDETFHNIYSTSQEQQMGAQAAAQINSTEKLDMNAKDNTRVQSVAQPIFEQARKMRPELQYQIRIIDSPEVNAFSLPGGYLYIYTGLLDKLGTDDDALAGVIGHETAHAVRRHVVKQMSDAGIKGSLVELLGIATNNPSIYNGASTVYELEQLHYSREDEYEADKYGLMFAYNAGYDPYGMIRMFHRLEDLEEQEGGEPPVYVEDHPITQNRALRTEDLIKILKANDGKYPDMPAAPGTPAAPAASTAATKNY